jgi:uncharacterized protein
MMGARAGAGTLALAAWLAWGSAHAATPIPPPPTAWVTDHAAFLSPAATQEIDARLAGYARETGHEVLVYIDHTTGGVPIEDWAVKAFESWRVGRKGIDDGVVLFVFADDHRLRIEVGYGLEDRVTDLAASRIINDDMTPRIRGGDRDGAVRAAVDALLSDIGGGAAGAPAIAARIATWKLVMGGLALLFILGWAVTHPGLAWLLLMSIGSGRGGGFGGGGGGGGFSGGGGRSGGGGASGSW